eukprot:gene4845-7609_t
MSPWPPNAAHAAQYHVGHFTFVGMTLDTYFKPDVLKNTLRAYTAGVFLSDSATAKAVLTCLTEVVDRLSRISAIMQRAG